MQSILVIEDDLSILDNIRDLLEEEGYHVLTAHNGLEGIHEALVNIPDLIISDVMLPEIDGYGVIEELRKHPTTATIPFIYLSAMSDLKDHRRGMNTGADDYLTKPYRVDDLLQAITIRLDKQEMLNQSSENKLKELRSNISRIIPHEFRTPLLAIIGFSQILMEDWPELSKVEINEMLLDIYKAGGRLEELTEKYSLLSELELLKTNRHKVISLRNQPCSETTAILRNAGMRVASRFNRTADLSFSLDAGNVQSPAYYFETLAKEIIENAFKFSEPGTTVHITSKTLGKQYMVKISDAGKGMNDKQIECIGAFSQFDREKYEQQGLGLGLALVTEILDLFIGDLRIKSAPGAGTSITFALPNVPINVPVF